MTVAIQKIFGKKTPNSRIDYILLSRSGVSMLFFDKILEFTGLSIKEIAEMLPVSERQLIRYDSRHILRKDISSHLLQLIELFEKGFNVFGQGKFQLWLRTKNTVLGSRKPIGILDTPIGIQMVEDIIGRIEHGVYS